MNRARTRLAALALAMLPLAGLAALAPSPGSGGPADALAALAGPGPVVVSPDGTAPALLSQTGLRRGDGTIDPRNRPFAPQYPLWTDGAAKRRWIRLPAGATIDVADVDAWRFPPGTTLWKEFAWEGRPVETRMIRRETDGTWTFASYLWRADGSDAELAPAEGVPGYFALPASVTGGRTGRRHSIPGTADCLSCHGSAPSPVLGFDALQLSDDRDPNAPHAESLPPGAVTLATLAREGRLSPARPELVSAPPRIRGGDPVERSALGYLHGNCGTCHNPRGPLARLGFSLRHSVAGEAAGEPEPALVSTREARSRFVVPGVAPESSLVVAPGDPARSALAYRMGSRRAVSQMPPLGTSVADSAAVALVERWIAGMTPAAAGGRERVAAAR